MEKRLDDVVLAASYDAGHQSLPWNPGQPSGLLTGVDIDAILASSNAHEIIQHLPVQPLYYALKQRGFEESLEVLPHLTEEQVTHIADYEAWEGDNFSPRKLFRLMKAFGAVSAGELYKRFSELDEEYQIASLQNMFHVYEVEHVYDLPESVAERVHPMPCNRVFYEILTDNKEDFEFVEELMNAAKAENLRYAYSLLGHASFMPPNESEGQVAQFRKARLEEDGFVSYEESLKIFAPIDRRELAKRWKHEGHSKDALMLQGSDLVFLDAVLIRARDSGANLDELFQVHHNLLYLANALCAAARVNVDDVHGVHRVLEQGKALVSLGLEYAADGSIDLGAKILLKEHTKTLFQAGYGIIEDLRADVVKALTRIGLPRADRLERLYMSRQWGQIVLEIDRNWTELVGLEASEILKGLLNRFPMVAVGTPKDPNRIIFHPIASLADFYELELSVQAVLAYAAAARLTGKELNRSIDILLREAASENIRRGMQPGSWDVEQSITQLTAAWQERLNKESKLWMAGNDESREEALNLAMAMIYDCLHGLIVLPGGQAPGQQHQEMI